jgi:nitroimidazol reductase NimA-like FMN-containing flavoprotein (pyridoxamine 5'-phosphate oxidase superfamily)
MPLSRDLALTPERLDELMTTSLNMRIATVGPGSRINLTPLWFGWAGGNVYTFCRGQKVVNLRRSPAATVLVDRNERFPELQGAMFQGRAMVLEDAEAEAADPHLEEARLQMGAKYAAGRGDPAAPARRNEATARGRTGRWVRFEPERIVTWDNTRMKR